MLSLTDDPHLKISYKGVDYPVDFAFDTVINYFNLIEDEELTNQDKIEGAVDLFFGNCKNRPSLDDINFYYFAIKAINREINDYPYGKNEKSGTSSNYVKYVDYQKDAGAIYAGFYQQYGIDLTKERGKLQWSQFHALFDGLSDKTQIQKIIKIRQKSLSDLDKDDIGEWQSAKAYYALEDLNNAESMKRTQAIFDMIVQNTKKERRSK